MTRLTLGLSPETPTPNPAPRGGELFWAQFFGAKARKTALLSSPLPGGKRVRGMGLPTKPAKDLCKAVREIDSLQSLSLNKMSLYDRDEYKTPWPKQLR